MERMYLVWVCFRVIWLRQRRPTAGDDGVRPSGGSFWTHREGSRRRERGIAAGFP